MYFVFLNVTMQTFVIFCICVVKLKYVITLVLNFLVLRLSVLIIIRRWLSSRTHNRVFWLVGHDGVFLVLEPGYYYYFILRYSQGLTDNTRV